MLDRFLTRYSLLDLAQSPGPRQIMISVAVWITASRALPATFFEVLSGTNRMSLAQSHVLGFAGHELFQVHRNLLPFAAARHRAKDRLQDGQLSRSFKAKEPRFFIAPRHKPFPP
jgi:hypothetical protein